MMALILVPIGGFTVTCAALDLDFFMNHRKARLVAAILGRTGPRIFYGILGTGMALMGMGVAVGSAL